VQADFSALPGAIFNVYRVADVKPGDDAWKIRSGSLLPAGMLETALAQRQGLSCCDVAAWFEHVLLSD
jgi:hypothetical protein